MGSEGSRGERSRDTGDQRGPARRGSSSEIQTLSDQRGQKEEMTNQRRMQQSLDANTGRSEVGSVRQSEQKQDTRTRRLEGSRGRNNRHETEHGTIRSSGNTDQRREQTRETNTGRSVRRQTTGREQGQLRETTVHSPERHVYFGCTVETTLPTTDNNHCAPYQAISHCGFDAGC